MSDNAKELIFEEEARKKLKDGIDILADVIGVTLGPKGRNIGLDASWGAPQISNDGNQIIKDIEQKDQYLNMGISIGKEVANKMKERCGDGTTSSILLLRSLLQNGIKNVASGSSPIEIKRGIDKAVNAVVAELNSNSIPVQSSKERQNIASASASGDQEIGKLISQAFEKVGDAGVITIEEGKSRDTTIEIVEGMQFDRGYISGYFCTNNETLSVDMTAPLILITDKKISSIQDILPLLQTIGSTGKELLIIADDVEAEALSTLVINKLRGTLKVCAVKAPGFGDRRKAMLQDLAILTGATCISDELDYKLKDTTVEMLGNAEKIMIDKDKTTIVGGKGTEEAIKERVQLIENEIANSTSDYDKEKLEERKAKLAGGVAVIYVGGMTEPEMKRRKQIFKDSLNSTRAALEEGILPGGGIALLKARDKINSLNLSPEEMIGAKSIFKACEAPFRQLVENSGFDSSIYLEEVLNGTDNIGFNVLTNKIEDLYKAGVLDPAKVIKNALINASSAAGVILLSECLIGDAPDEE